MKKSLFLASAAVVGTLSVALPMSMASSVSVPLSQLTLVEDGFTRSFAEPAADHFGGHGGGGGHHFGGGQRGDDHHFGGHHGDDHHFGGHHGDDHHFGGHRGDGHHFGGHRGSAASIHEGGLPGPMVAK